MAIVEPYRPAWPRVLEFAGALCALCVLVCENSIRLYLVHRYDQGRANGIEALLLFLAGSIVAYNIWTMRKSKQDLTVMIAYALAAFAFALVRAYQSIQFYM